MFCLEDQGGVVDYRSNPVSSFQNMLSGLLHRKGEGVFAGPRKGDACPSESALGPGLDGCDKHPRQDWDTFGEGFPSHIPCRIASAVLRHHAQGSREDEHASICT